jgi:hypothetical protein
LQQISTLAPVRSPEPDAAQTLAIHDTRTPVGEGVAASLTRARADRRFGWLILLAFSAAFTLKVAVELDAPFGFYEVTSSVDAYNGATWSTGARALRESGPIDSKFGAVWSRAPGDYRYASHPPMIYPATALAQWLAPGDELGARLLVFLASIAAAVLLFLLLCELDLPPPLAAASVGIGLSVPMFLTYGTMLDTLMLGLPFAVGYLLVWQRGLNGGTNRVAMGVAAAAVCLVAWEGVILVAATMLVTVLLRRNHERWKAIAAAGVGAASAVVVTALWQVWVYGSLGEVLDHAAVRAGGSGFSLSDYFHRQLTFLQDTFGFPALVVLGIGVVVLLASARFRPLGLAVVATSIAYATGFVEGSFVHDYWNYWVLITFVLGIGALGSLLLHARPRAWLLIPFLFAIGLVVFGFRAELNETHLRSIGDRQAQKQPRLTRRVQGQRWVPLVQIPVGAGGQGGSIDDTSPGATAAWVLPQARFYFRVPLRFTTTNEASAFARRHPDAWIVLNYGSVGGGELVRGRDAMARLG